MTEVRSFASGRQGTLGTSFGYATWENVYTQFAVSPDNIIVLPDRWNSQVCLYDVATGTELATLSTADTPAAVDISADGTIAVVSHFAASGTVTKIDLTTQTVAAEFSSIPNLYTYSVRVSHDNAYALVGVSSNVLFVDLETGDITASVHTGTVMDLEISYDGAYAFVTGVSCSVIDIASQSLVATPALTWCYEAAVSPVDYCAVALNNRNAEDVQFYNIDGASSYMEGVVPSGSAPEGDGPGFLALADDGTTLVVGNATSGNVSILDMVSQSVLSYIDTGTSVTGLAVTSDGSCAVVLDGYLGTATVVDLAGGAAVATLPVTEYPYRVLISPDDQTAYVATGEGTDTIYFIDLNGASSSVVDTLQPGNIGQMTLTSDGSTLGIYDYYGREFILVDTATHAVTARVALSAGSYNDEVVFSPDGSTAYVTDYYDDTVYVVHVDGASSSLAATLTGIGQPKSIVVDAQGEFAYVGGTYGTSNYPAVYVIHTATNSIVRTMVLDDSSMYSQEIYLSGDNSILYATARYDAIGGNSRTIRQALYRIRAAGAGSALIDATDLSEDPFDFVFSETLKTAAVAQPYVDGVELVDFQSTRTDGVHVVELARKEVVTGINFGNQALLGAIQGCVWNDLDEDGAWDQADEAALEGWTVYLDSNDNGQFDDGVDPSTVTDSQGDYWLTDLDGGTYTVAVELPTGWEPSLPAAAEGGTYQISLGWGEIVSSADFGLFVPPGEIHGYKWHDVNGDGLWDQDEIALAGWTIYLDINRNGLFDEDTEPFQVTGTDGSYHFTDLAPDTYVIGEAPQAGWEQTYPIGSASSSSVTSLSAETTLSSGFHTISTSETGSAIAGPGSTLADAFLVPEEALAETEAFNAGLAASPVPDGERPDGDRPYGADNNDLSEYMLGDIWVTVVLLESDGSIDANSEDWTTTEITNVKAEIQEGLQWWEDTLQAAPTVSPVHDLSFHIDFTYADTPVATGYEPITRPYSNQSLWIDDFLDEVGYNSASSYFTDLDLWNDAQRIANNAHWAYTVFVCDSSYDSDNMFSDGYFAYAYLGGPFTVMTYGNDGWGIGNMGQVLAHETGHIFYALDEYSGAASYNDYSGYYNTQNLNAIDDNPDTSTRVASIMAESSLQNVAYSNHTSSPTSLQMVGWSDSDADGIFDVLDVPLTLTGSGSYNFGTGQYQFSGTSSVQTLTNLNPQSSAGDITINTVDEIQYRLDGGPWIGVNSYGTYTADVSLSIPVSGAAHQIEIRTIDLETGVASNVFSHTFGSGGDDTHTVLLNAGEILTDVNFGNWTVVDVADVAVSDTFLTSADAGSGQFSVSVVFTESMDTTAVPSLVLSPDVIGDTTPTLANPSGAWSQTTSENDTYTVTYDVLDSGVEIADVTIDVTGACSVGGEDQRDYTPTSQFSIDMLSPSVSSLLPADDAADVHSDTDLVITFHETVQKGSGNLVIRLADDDSVVETIAVDSSLVSVVGAIVSVQRSAILLDRKDYYVEVDAGAFEDLAGNSFAGITGTTAWNFTIDDPPPLAVSSISLELTGTIQPFSTLDVTLNGTIESDSFDVYDVALLNLDGVETSSLDSVGGVFNDCFLGGSTLYVASGSGLQVFDVSTPAAATLLGGQSTVGRSHGVDVVGDLAYVADNVVGLQIFDISDPNAIVAVGGFAISGTPYDVEVIGNLAYVAAGTGGLFVLDVTDPSAVVQVGLYDTSGQSYAVDIVGDRAYVADYNTGLQILDVSDPAAIVYLGEYDTTGAPRGVDVVGNLAYMADRSNGLEILDVSDPTSVTYLGGFDSANYAYDVQVVGNLAYLADEVYGLFVLDVTDPTTVTLLGSCRPSSGVCDVDVVGSIAYAGCTTQGLVILDVSDPTAISVLGQGPASGTAMDVELVGSLVVVADKYFGLKVLSAGQGAVSVTHTADLTYRVDFGQTLPDGEYALLLGPQIQSTAGTWMNQDQDAVDHEIPDDVYFTRFQIGTPPTVTSIERLSPSQPLTNADSVVFRVTFSEHVSDVSTADFTLTDVADTIVGESITAVSATDGTTIDVTVNTGVSGDGELRLDLLVPGATITDDTGYPLETGFTSGESYVIDRIAPAPPVVTGISDDTGVDPDDRITSDQTLLISGTAEAGVLVEVFLGTNSLGTTNADGSGVWTFDHTGTTLADGAYQLKATAQDAAGNISADSAVCTVTLDGAVPLVDNLTPADDSTGAALDSNLTIVFDENIHKGTGNIVVRRSSDDSIVETIAVTAGQVTIAANVVTIDPSSDFAGETGYYVQVDAGAFEDLAGNEYAGIGDKQAWNFTTTAIDVLYVDDDATVADPNGFSWDAAFSDLESALAYARGANGDGAPDNDVTEICVAGGTYIPTALSDADLDGTIDTDPRSVTFSLVDGVSIYGGYAGLTPQGADTADTRDTAIYITTLDGDLDGNDASEIAVDELRTHATRAENAYTVVTGIDVTATLDGLAVRGGNANAATGDSPDPSRSGGGAYLRGTADVSFIDVSISGNSANGWGGGGILNYSSTVTVTSSTISGNSGNYGGGIGNYSGTVTVINSTISGNSGNYGGGIGNYGGTMTVTSSTISDNSGNYGGGISNSSNGAMSVTSSTVSGNSGNYGGGISNSGNGTMTVTNSTISGNSSQYDGGGIRNSSAAMTVSNSTFMGNSAKYSGGGICNSGSGVVTLTNLTVSGNSALRGGGGICIYSVYRYGGAATLANSIVALNTAASNAEIEGPLTAESGFNLIGIDPAFVRPPSPGPDATWGTADDDAGDLHLTESSPAVNMGNNALVPPGLETDLEGQPRIYGGRVDIGAHEYQADPTAGRETPSAVVTTLLDVVDLYDGAISLREALFYSGVEAIGSPITFDAALDGGTITLAGSSLIVDRSVQVNASSLGELTIDANSQSRAITILADNVELVGLTVTGGVARYGGGIGNYGTLTLTNSTISGNSANYSGGGIYNYCGTVTVIDSTITDNSANYSGGGIYSLLGPVAVGDSTILGNSADDGGGIYSTGQLTVTNSNISGNSATDGGGILNYEGTVTVTNSNISDNSADTGGGIYDDTGTVTVTNSSISGNYGDGIYGYSATVTVTGSNISGNYGNGIRSGSTLAVAYSTISGNYGCGISVSGGTATVSNTIVALNYNAEYPDISGALTTESVFNLIGIDPGFVRSPGPGPDGTWGTDDDDAGDLHLTASSPAVNMGSNALVPPGLETDVDGQPRVYGGRVDIGAYEYQADPMAGRETPSAVVTTLLDAVDLYDGAISLREALFYRGTEAISGPITFDATLDGGTITLAGTSLTVDQSVRVDASSLGSLTIDAGSRSRVITTWADDVELVGLTVTGGSAGGIKNYGGLTITDSTISGNSNGGGITNDHGTLTLTNSTISGNSTETVGGGIYDYSGTVTVTNSTVSGNSALTFGGGIYSRYGTVTVTNSTISGNSASDGGGIFNNGTLTVTNSTISGNSASVGGGIRNDRKLTVANTIVALNRATISGPDVYGSAAGSYNLIGDGAGMTGLVHGADGNLVGTTGVPIDPLFVRNPSAGPDGTWGTSDDDYGDLRLLFGGPAIDAGSNALLPADTFDLDGDGDTTEPIPFDLDGGPRVENGTVDMGACEFREALITATDSDDTIVLTLGAVGGSWHEAVVNGNLTTYDPTLYRTIRIDALVGNDTVTILGTDQDETVTLQPGSADVFGQAYEVHVANVETISVNAGDGSDSLTMTGSAGSNRLFSYADYATFRDSTRTFSFRVEDFESVSVDASAGSSNYAFAYDSPGDDYLDANPDRVILTRHVGLEAETQTTASGFERVYIYGVEGGTDEAALLGAEDARNRFYGYADHSVFTESQRSFYFYVEGFDTVAAEAPEGTYAYAYFYDSPGNDRFTASPTSASMERPEPWSDVNATGFNRIYAYARQGGDDAAELVGSDSGNRFRSYPTYGTLTDDVGSFYQYASGFDSLTAVGFQAEASTDRAYLYDSPGDDTFSPAFYEDDAYQGGCLSDVAGTNENWIKYFDLVYARSSDSGTNDTIAVADDDDLAYLLIDYGTW